MFNCTKNVKKVENWPFIKILDAFLFEITSFLTFLRKNVKKGKIQPSRELVFVVVILGTRLSEELGL